MLKRFVRRRCEYQQWFFVVVVHGYGFDCEVAQVERKKKGFFCCLTANLLYLKSWLYGRQALSLSHFLFTFFSFFLSLSLSLLLSLLLSPLSISISLSISLVVSLLLSVHPPFLSLFLPCSISSSLHSLSFPNLSPLTNK